MAMAKDQITQGGKKTEKKQVKAALPAVAPKAALDVAAAVAQKAKQDAAKTMAAKQSGAAILAAAEQVSAKLSAANKVNQAYVDLLKARGQVQQAAKAKKRARGNLDFYSTQIGANNGILAGVVSRQNAEVSSFEKRLDDYNKLPTDTEFRALTEKANQLKDREQRISQLERRARASVNLYNRAARREAETYNQHAQKAQQTRLADQAYRDLISEYQGREEYLSSGAAQYQRELVVESRNQQLAEIDLQLSKIKNDPMGYLRENGIETNGQPVSTYLYPEMDRLNKQKKELELQAYQDKQTTDAALMESSAMNDPDFKRFVSEGKKKLEGTLKTIRNNGGDDTFQKDYAAMSEDERNIYAYLYGKDGNEKRAIQYKSYLQRKLNAKQNDAYIKMIQQAAKEDPIGMGLATIPLQPYAAAKTFGDELVALSRSAEERSLPADPNTPGQRLIHGNQAARQEGIERLPNNFLKTLAQAGYAIADMVPSYVMSMAGFPVASTAYMFATQQAGSYADAAQRGVSVNQAIGFATVDAAVASVLEKSGIDSIGEAVGGAIAQKGESGLLRRIVSAAVQSFVGEGGEEAAEALVQPVYDYVINGSKSAFALSKQQYLAEGKTEAEATRLALGEIGREAIDSFIVGGLAGVGMSAPQVAVVGAADKITEHAYDRALYQDAVQNGKEYYAINQLTKGELARQSGNLDIEQDYKKTHYVQEVLNALQKNQQGKAEYSIQELPNGEKVTVVDTRQNIFEGKPKKEFPKIARREILDHFKGQVLPLGENDLARITSRTAGEYAYPHKVPESTIDSAKMRASTELDNLLKTAEYVYSAEDNKNHSEATLGFDYYKTKFIVDGHAFEGLINIATSEKGRMLYDITKINEVSDMNGKSAARMAQSTSAFGNLSNNSIPTFTENVNDKKYLFAGQNAETADRGALAKVQTMREQGADSETARKETGWFQGMDGKWRFEIDDSQMRLKPVEINKSAAEIKEANARFLAAQEELLDRSDMTSKDAADFREYLRTRQNDSEKAKQLYAQLSETSFGAQFRESIAALEHLENAQKKNDLLLGDLLEHPQLYRNYPALASVPVRFEQMSGGELGSFDGAVLRLSTSLLQNQAELKNTLIHEIQHAVQEKEGFTHGTNPQYWAAKEGYSNKPEQVYDETFSGLTKDQKNQWLRYKELDRVLSDLFLKDGQEAEYNRYEAMQDEMYARLYSEPWFQSMLDADRTANSPQKFYHDLYRNTAGEIEARDVEHRNEFSPQQRRDTAPDLGDANTVFAEEDVASSRVKQFKTPSQWVDPAELGRRAMKAQFAKNETRRSGIMAGAADAVITQAEALSSAFHTEIVFDRALSAQIEGYYQDGKIHLNAKLESGKAAQIVFGHELTHSLEKTKTYRDFVNFALNQMGNETAVKNAVREKIELYRVNGVELDTAGAVREIVAQFAAEKLFADEQTVRRLAVEKPSLANRILTWIRETLAKLKNEPEKAALLKAEQLYSRMLREADGHATSQVIKFSYTHGKESGSSTTYFRYTNKPNGFSQEYGRAEFVDNPEESEIYGDYLYTVNSEDLVPIETMMDKIAKALEEDYENAVLSKDMEDLVEFALEEGKTYRDIAKEFDPEDIVMAACAWDSEEMVQWFFDHYYSFDENMKGVSTKNGAVVFDPSIIVSHGNKNEVDFEIFQNTQELMNEIASSGRQFSISPETEAERLNRKLLKENEELRRQMTLTEHPMPSPAKLRAAAKAILKGYSSKYNVNELYTGMEQICENIQNRSQTIGGVQVDYSFEDAQAAALSLAGEVIANSTVKNSNEDYKPLRDLVRNTKIAVPQEIREDIGNPYSEFKAAHRELHLAKEGVSIEDLWSVLSEEYPALFDSSKTSNPADMLVHLADVMESTRAFEYNPVESGEIDFETETRALANDILERCYSVPNRAPTFADKQAMKLAKAQQDAQKKIDRLTEQYEAKLKKEKEKQLQLRDTEQERRNRLIESQKEKAQRKREGEALREIRRETLKTLQWLSKNRRKAPADLRDKFDDVLADIDLYAIKLANSAHWSEKRKATWKDLAEIYKTAKANDPNFLPSQELEKVITRLDNPKIGEMDLNALQDLYRAAVCLQTEFYDRNKLLGMERDMEIDQTARKSVEEMKEARGKKTITKKQEFLNEQQLTPMNYLLRMAGWNRNSDFYKMAQQLERGERQMKDYEVRAKRMLDDYIKKNKKWLEKADGQGSDGIWYQVEVPELQELHMGDKPMFGEMVTVYMTPVQKVHLYLESQNDDNLRHMTGGRTFADKERYAKGQREKAFAEGTTVRLAPETVKRLVSDLTEEEMGLARALKPYYQDFAAKRINEVSNVLYGYDKAMTKDYAPIYTNSNYNKGDFGVYNITAEGVGNMKEREYGVNPSLNIGALDAFERHVRQTSRFVGMAVPARNWTSLMNWKSRGSSFKAKIAKRWGLEAEQYIEDLVTDLQGGTIGDKGFLEKLGDKVLSNYVSGTFGANPSIVLKQAASFPQFAASLGWVNMPKNPIKLIKAAPESLINTYTSELAYRELGYATPETAQLKNNPGLLETNKAMKFIFAGGAITAMDAGTVKRGWIWAENKVKREHPELEIGTKEQIDAGESPFYQKVAQEFEDAVALTQPMYDKMHRAKIMKNQKGLGKALTMFRTVPVQMYNLLRRNFGELEFANSDYKKAVASGNAVAIQKAKEKKKKAARAAAGSISSLLISNLLLEGIEFLTQLWRNGAKKYRDEEGEITAESFLKQFGKGYLTDIAGTVIGGKELTEFLYNVIMGEKWSGIQIPGGEQLNDLLESVQDITKTIEKFVADGINLAKNKGDLGEYFRKNGADYAGAVKEIVQKIAVYGFGFPAENLEKYVMGTIRSISPELAVAAEGILAAPEKSELDDLHGGALEKKIQNIFQNRGLKLSDEAVEELYILYEDGYRDSVPGDVPKAITVNEESCELTATQAQKYDKAWKETIGDSINELTKREDFQACEQEDQERMLQKIYDHAKGIAKKAAFPETELDKATEKANALIKAFDSTAAWAAWEVKTANRTSSEKRDLLRGLKLTDTQKREVYEIDLSNKQGELIDALKNAGFGFDEFLKLQNQKASFKGETAKLEFSHWLDKNYSEEQADQIRGAFYKTELRYDKLTDAGMSEDAAYSLHTELAALEPEQGKEDVSKRQQLVYTAFSRDYNDEEKQAALSVLMGESFEKLEAAQKEGIPLETFMDFYLNKNVIKADKDENGKSISGKKYGSKQQKIGAYIDSLPGLSDGQKDYLYKTIYETGSNLDLTPWHGGTRYEGELPTNLVEGSKPAQRTAKPSQGSGKPQKKNQTGKQTTPQKTGSGSGSSGEKKSGGTGTKMLKLPTVADLLKSYKTSKPSTPMQLSLPTVNLLNRGGDSRIKKVSLPSVNQTMADMMRKVIPSPKKITRSDSQRA